MNIAREKKRFLHTQSGSNNKERKTINLSCEMHSQDIYTVGSHWKKDFISIEYEATFVVDEME